MMYPKIYLAIDNCVFYKRWTSPDEWARKIKELGIQYIEASADTELDPLYMGSAYFHDWIQKVQEAEEKYGVKVCNLYSGHGTYTTLGLTHSDVRVRRNMVENWFFPMVRTAGKLKCGMGFFAHAIPHEILQHYTEYQKYVDILVDLLSEINQYAAMVGCGDISIERMYTPHQYPWRQQDIRELLCRVTQQSGRNFYFTEDLGHHDVKFQRPSKDELLSQTTEDIWFGTDRAFALMKQHGKQAWHEVEREMDKNPHLFSENQDGNYYETLRTLGCYSPIVHLQQTNGRQSLHLPFTESENKNGIISARRVLQGIKEAYDTPVETGMPDRCDKIYLTLEIFSGTASIMQHVLEDCTASVRYWRRYIPSDGIALDQLLEQCGGDCEK